MAVNDIAVQEFVNAIKEPPQDTNNTYNATVSHIDDEGVVWVYLQGSEIETPTASTSSEVEAGDSVTVQWRNNKLYIGGNYSNPSAGTTTVMPSVNFVSELLSKDISADSVSAATGYIGELTAEHITADDIQAGTGYIKELRADNITADDISASSGYIKELKADNIEADDIIADHGTIGSLDVNYAKVNAANIDSAAIRNAWVDKIMVQTGLLAYSSQIYTLDAIEVNAANITAGTLDVNRLIVTVGEGSSAQKYLVNIDPSTGTPSYEKLDGNIVEPRTITANKIVANSITTDEITVNNLVGTSGWINLHEGKFFYGNGADFATSANAISWNGSKLQIKADEFLLSTGKTIQDSIESVENWFYSVPPTTSNPPASSWTTTNLKEQHLRDIYFDTTSGKSYRWAKEGSTYKWVEIEDVELAALAKDLHDNYPPRSEFTVAPNQIQSTVSAAQTAATNAANSATDTKLQSYYTKTQTDSAITQRAGEISLSVAQTEIGKIEVGGRNLLTGTAESKELTTAANQNWFNPAVYKLSTYADTAIADTNNTQISISFDYSITGVDTAFNMTTSFRTSSSGSYSAGFKVAEIPVGSSSGHAFGTRNIIDSMRQYAPGYGIMISGSGNANANAKVTISNVKLEFGNKATDWSPAPEDLEAYTDSQVSAAKAEIKITTDGISSEVSKVSSAKYVTSSGSGWTLANIKSYAAEGHIDNWYVTSTENIRAGDVVYVYGKDTTRNCYVYIKTTVRSVESSTKFSGVSHGYEDILPVETIKSTINQSADSVKIQANHVEIDGTATFNAIKSSVESTVQTAVDGIEVGGRNLLRRSDYAVYNTSDYNSNGNGATFSEDRITVPFGKEVFLYPYTSQRISTVIPSGTKITCSVYVYKQTIADGNHRVYVSPLRSNNTAYWVNIHNIGVNSTGRHTWTFTTTEDAYGFVVDFDSRNSTSGEMILGRIKVEIGDKATDWTPAPEDARSEIDAKKSVHTLDTTYSYTYADILTYSAEGFGGTWVSNGALANGVKIGDTVRLKVTVSDMSNAPVYVVGTVTDVKTNAVTIISHGLDTTIIDGGNILTNSITANQIAANAVKADELDTDSINNSGLLSTGALTVGAKSEVLNSNIQIGGTNLIPLSRNLRSFTIENGNQSTVTFTNADCYLTVTASTPLRYGLYYDIAVSASTTYTISFKASSVTGNTSLGVGNRTGSNTGWSDVVAYKQLVNGTNTATFTTSSAITKIRIYIGGMNGSHAYLSEMKLESGNKATDWSPALADMSGAKYLTSSYSQPYSRYVNWVNRTTPGTYTVTSSSGVNVGDVVYIECDCTTTGTKLYVQGEVTAIPRDTQVTIYPLGIVDRATYASKTATTYITHIDNDGIRIHPSSTENDSVVINANGMEVFKGGTTSAYSVAKYGDTARIGKEGGSHLILASDSMSMSDGTKDVFNLLQKTMYIYWNRNYKGRQFTNSTDRHVDSWDTNTTISTWDSIAVNYKLNNTSRTKKITSISNGVLVNDEIYVHFSYSGTIVTLTYGRGSSAASSDIIKLESAVVYYVTDKKLSQLHTGTYPNTTVSGALRIGNGTSDSNRINLMLVDWSGTGKFKGDILAFCGADSSGGMSLTKAEENIDAFKYKDANGHVYIDAYRVGRIVSLLCVVSKTTSIAPGANLYQLNLTNAHLPKPLGTNTSGTGISGKNMIIGNIYYNKTVTPNRYEFVCRNGGSTAVSTGGVGFTITYICQMDEVSGEIKYMDD